MFQDDTLYKLTYLLTYAALRATEPAVTSHLSEGDQIAVLYSSKGLTYVVRSE